MYFFDSFIYVFYLFSALVLSWFTNKYNINIPQCNWILNNSPVFNFIKRIYLILALEIIIILEQEIINILWIDPYSIPCLYILICWFHDQLAIFFFKSQVVLRLRIWIAPVCHDCFCCWRYHFWVRWFGFEVLKKFYLSKKKNIYIYIYISLVFANWCRLLVPLHEFFMSNLELYVYS